MVHFTKSKIIVTLFLSVFGAGCDRGSQVDLENATRSALDSHSNDPLSTQLRNLRVVSKSICGEVNLKDDNGLFAGFRIFVIEPNKEAVVAIPAAVQMIGWDRPLNICASDKQKAAFNAEQEIIQFAFRREIDKWKNEAELERLRLEALLKELESS